MKAIEQYFHVVLFIMLHKIAPSFMSVVLFILLYKVVLTFMCVDETLVCDHSNESY